MTDVIHIKSIEDIGVDCNGFVNLLPNTTYIVDNPAVVTYLAKRKVKRFNKTKYQKVLKIKG